MGVHKSLVRRETRRIYGDGGSCWLPNWKGGGVGEWGEENLMSSGPRQEVGPSSNVLGPTQIPSHQAARIFSHHLRSKSYLLGRHRCKNHTQVDSGCV
ncbi:hypothetical protein PVAP13_7NG407625 [Panicum virgatum]|uniref:Uncharacterized protein n=1 Tax=Panicum virgatum TaxID=38727 RepID=A0A8T0QEJ4_PANVG|nr:hypothetical protein PVAP13_7NG407625 [Panicum virgatum]